MRRGQNPAHDAQRRGADARPPPPEVEQARLAALRELAILDTEPEQPFDDLVGLAAQVFGAPLAGLSFIDGEREWFKARIGLPAAAWPRAGSLAQVVLERGELVALDALHDDRVGAAPLVRGEPRVRFYAARVVRSRGGEPVGALAVMDGAARARTEEGQRAALAALARQAEVLLELRCALRDEAARKELQEEMYRRLAHDLRSPLNALLLGAQLLSRERNLTPAGRDAAREIRECAEETHRRVSDFLEAARTKR